MAKKHILKSFTLIELIIVIVILAILASIALPKFMNLSQTTRSSVITQTAGALTNAMQIAKTRWRLNGQSGAGELTLDNGNTIQVDSTGCPIRYDYNNDSTIDDADVILFYERLMGTPMPSGWTAIAGDTHDLYYLPNSNNWGKCKVRVANPNTNCEATAHIEGLGYC